MITANERKRSADPHGAGVRVLKKDSMATDDAAEISLDNFVDEVNAVERRFFVVGNTAELIEYVTDYICSSCQMDAAQLQRQEIALAVSPLARATEQQQSLSGGLCYSFTKITAFGDVEADCEVYGVSPLLPIKAQVGICCNGSSGSRALGVVCLDWRKPELMVPTLLHWVSTIRESLKHGMSKASREQASGQKQRMIRGWATWFTQLAVSGSRAPVDMRQALTLKSLEAEFTLDLPLIIVLGHAEHLLKVERQQLSSTLTRWVQNVIRAIAVRSGASICSISANDAHASLETLHCCIAQQLVLPAVASEENSEPQLDTLGAELLARISGQNPFEREFFCIFAGWDTLSKIRSVTDEFFTERCLAPLPNAGSGDADDCVVTEGLLEEWKEHFAQAESQSDSEASSALIPAPTFKSFLDRLAGLLPEKPAPTTLRAVSPSKPSKLESVLHSGAVPMDISVPESPAKSRKGTLGSALSILSNGPTKAGPCDAVQSNASSNISLPSRPLSRSENASCSSTTPTLSTVTSAAAQHQVLSDFFSSLLSKKKST